MNLYVGTSGYSYPAWKGSFYPKDLSEKKMLAYYGEHFRTVEINHTHRMFPRAATLAKWAAQVPGDFQFVLKAHKRITHTKRLKDADQTLAEFLEAVAPLEKQLGPILFQLPENFQKDLPRLRDFLALLPRRHQSAFEFRHASWFDDEVFDLLRERQVAVCIAEADEDLDVPFVATASWGYLRLRLPDYSDADLKAWLKRVRDREWRDAYVFFKHEDEGRGPQLAARFMELAS